MSASFFNDIIHSEDGVRGLGGLCAVFLAVYTLQ